MADKENKVVKKKRTVRKKSAVIEEVKDNENKDKNKKYSFGLFEVILIMIVTTLFGLFVGSFVAYKKYSDKKVSCKEVREDLSDLVSVYDDIVNEYYGEIDKERIVDFAIAGMVSSLDDRYALYMDAEYANSLNEELNGSFVGLGVEVKNDENGYIVVVNVIEDTPASRYGIQPDDKIVSLDGINMIGEDVSTLVSNIKSNPIGTEKNIGILRGEETLNITVKLDVVNLKSVNGYSVVRDDKRIGVIVMSNFSSNTHRQFKDVYDKLSEDGLDSLVIDVRNNGGGYLSSANMISSMFLGNGDVIYKKTDGKEIEDVINGSEKEIEIPVVILVNGLTASSSEIFTSSLRENVNATVVGTKTYGKGMIQKLIQLSDNKYIKFSVQEWLTPNGNKIEGTGIIPDVEINLDEESGYDVQLEKAIEIAKEK